MSITDELREWWVCKFPVMDSELHKDFSAIADRIDAEHEKAMSRAGQLLDDAEKERDYNYAYWQDCKQKVLQGNITFNELSAKIERLEDEHRVELPKDADGEYIYVGDMMERGKARGHVIALMLSEYPKKWGGELHWGVQLEGEQAPTALDCFFRHYHAPTVEDVLYESLKHFGAVEERTPEVEEWLHEQAAKLRLAGSDAE